MAQHQGAADSYYNSPPQAPMQQGQQPYNNGYQQPQYPPPNYGQDYQNNAPPAPMHGGDGKQTFEQAFKLDRPKYNDLWAGILVNTPPILISRIEPITGQSLTMNSLS